MAHVQLRNQRTNQRVLPVFYTDNYVSLLPGESRTITIEAAAKDLGSDQPLVVLDGWNTTTQAQNFTAGGRSSIAPNTAALVPWAVRTARNPATTAVTTN
jgi:beta-mannosidase